jgi:prepilin peptidase CpaA
MLSGMPAFWLAIASAVAVAALIIGAASDMASRRIPNGVPAAVALSSVALLLMLPTGEALSSVALAAALFGLGAGAFAARLVGGGDVKLLAATCLWAGTLLFSLLIVIMALASVTIALLMLLFERRPAVPGGDRLVGLKAPLPFGVAIAAGGVIVIMLRADLLPWG